MGIVEMICFTGKVPVLLQNRQCQSSTGVTKVLMLTDYNQ